MKELLTNPILCFKMNRDFFGNVGEFATSPDISFGDVHLHGLIASSFMTKGFYGNLNILLDV
jgi:hypothetical protein